MIAPNNIAETRPQKPPIRYGGFHSVTGPSGSRPRKLPVSPRYFALTRLPIRPTFSGSVEGIRVTVANTQRKLHVPDPYFPRRGVCGRVIHRFDLVSEADYLQAPEQRRCKKCAQRLWRVDAYRRFAAEGKRRAAAALEAPGRQRLLFDGGPL